MNYLHCYAEDMMGYVVLVVRKKTHNDLVANDLINSANTLRKTRTCVEIIRKVFT